SDAELVKKLKSEGAIILGKTNTPELCFCQETDNKLYGRTNNARDTSRTAGGSSGGEAVMISVGGAAAGLGSDIGGSIRFPCHFNGVIGFKSGNSQVSSVG
ncbi:amidase, partial [Microvirga sp. 3-52]|nr:amidase [Microvirga sp. 3-52]